MLDISEQKSKMRKEIRAKVREWSCLNDLRSASKSLCGKILGLEEYKNSDVVLSYIPLKNEADCVPVLLDAMEKGKIAAVPRCLPGTSLMDFCAMENALPLESQLAGGSYGILEPKDFLDTLDFDEPPLSADGNSGKPRKVSRRAKIFVVVPGLAFSIEGKRLGRGKGFYDRFFEKLEKNGYKNVFLCGVCFPCQVAEEIPCGEFDRKVDLVLF